MVQTAKKFTANKRTLLTPKIKSGTVLPLVTAGMDSRICQEVNELFEL
jgi:hypothetical protein